MRTLPVVLGPLIVVAAVAGAGVVLLRAGDPERLAVAPPAPHTQVVRDGDRVSASGSVVSVPGRPVRFCAPVAQDAIGYAPGQEPAPAYCPFGVDVEAVDLADLADRREKDGSLEGQTALTGVWRDGKLVVQEQGPPEPYGEPEQAAAPPCDPPQGGWPRDPSLLLPMGGEVEGDVNLLAEQPAMDRYRAQHPGDVVTIALLRPYPDSVLMGVSVVDGAAAARAEAALRAAYGERLCVVSSRSTRAQVTAAQAEFVIGSNDATRLGIHGGAGEGVSDALQIEVGYDLVLVTEEIVSRAARHPPGLIALRPWLLPA